MKNILHITTAHSKDDIRIFQKEIMSLKKLGFSVSLLAKGFEDIKINDINIYAFKPPNNRFERFFYTNFLILFRVIKLNPSICHFHDPDFLFFAILLRLIGKRVVYDVHENVPKQILSKEWIPWVLRKPISIIMNIVELIVSYIFINNIVAATDSIAARFPKHKTITINNFPIESEFNTKISEFDRRDIAGIYVGGLTRIRGIKHLIKAFCNDKCKDITLFLAGSFEDKDFEREMIGIINKNKNKNIIYLGYTSRETTIKYLYKSRIGFVLFLPEQNHIESSPNKLFEYMASGLPVIASNFPEWEKLIKEIDCWIVVDPSNHISIIKAISYLINNKNESQRMGNNGREAILKIYNWSNEEKKLYDMYTSFYRKTN